MHATTKITSVTASECRSREPAPVPAATIKAPGLHYYLSAQGCRAVLMSLSRRARSPAAAMVEMDLMRGLIPGLLWKLPRRFKFHHLDHATSGGKNQNQIYSLEQYTVIPTATYSFVPPGCRRGG